jgi:hypothetical protein
VANLVAKKVELSHANHIEMKSAIKLVSLQKKYHDLELVIIAILMPQSLNHERAYASGMPFLFFVSSFGI